MDKASIIILIIALIFAGIMIFEIYILYFNADYVKCDSFGNCQFTTVIQNISRYCYENGKEVNCSASGMNIEIPEGEYPL